MWKAYISRHSRAGCTAVSPRGSHLFKRGSTAEKGVGVGGIRFHTITQNAFFNCTRPHNPTKTPHFHCGFNGAVAAAGGDWLVQCEPLSSSLDEEHTAVVRVWRSGTGDALYTSRYTCIVFKAPRRTRRNQWILHTASTAHLLLWHSAVVTLASLSDPRLRVTSGRGSQSSQRPAGLVHERIWLAFDRDVPTGDSTRRAPLVTASSALCA